EGIGAAEADEGDGESRGDHEPAVEGSSIVAKHGISETAGLSVMPPPGNIGGRAGRGHPIYFGHERCIGGSNGVLPDIRFLESRPQYECSRPPRRASLWPPRR